MAIIDFSRIDGLHHEYQRRVASTIKDIYPTIRLLKLEFGHPEFNPVQPFALVDEPGVLPPYVIRTLHESEIDARLIAWLIMNDSQNPDAVANKWEILQTAEKALDAKLEMEVMEEKKDMLKSMMKSTKNTYRHNGQILRK